jgi:hypothetical protein
MKKPCEKPDCESCKLFDRFAETFGSRFEITRPLVWFVNNIGQVGPFIADKSKGPNLFLGYLIPLN